MGSFTSPPQFFLAIGRENICFHTRNYHHVLNMHHYRGKIFMIIFSAQSPSPLCVALLAFTDRYVGLIGKLSMLFNIYRT